MLASASSLVCALGLEVVGGQGHRASGSSRVLAIEHAGRQIGHAVQPGMAVGIQMALPLRAVFEHHGVGRAGHRHQRLVVQVQLLNTGA
jgi:hypothetical protein